jgi:hypothetical protein
MRYQKNSSLGNSEVTASLRNILYIILACLSLLAMAITAYGKWMHRGIMLQNVEGRCAVYDSTFKVVVPEVQTLRADVDTLKNHVESVKKTVEDIAESLN